MNRIFTISAPPAAPAPVLHRLFSWLVEPIELDFELDPEELEADLMDRERRLERVGRAGYGD